MDPKNSKTPQMDSAKCANHNRIIDETYGPADGGPYAGGKTDQKYIDEWHSQRVDCASLKQNTQPELPDHRQTTTVKLHSKITNNHHK